MDDGIFTSADVVALGRLDPPSFAAPIKIAFRKAAAQTVKAARATGAAVGNLFKGDRLLNTGLQIASLAIAPAAFHAALLDHNLMRKVDAVAYPLISLAFMFCAQGTAAPAGKTPAQKWWNAVKSPNKSTMYCGYAVTLVLAAGDFGSYMYYGFLGDRPVQSIQGALLAACSGTYGRSLWKNAVATEREAARKNGIIIPADEVPKGRSGKFLKVIDDKIVGSRHTAFYICAASTVAQTVEALHLRTHNYNSGQSMLYSLGLTSVLMAGGKIFGEMQWDKSRNRPYFWRRAWHALPKLAFGAKLFVAADVPKTSLPIQAMPGSLNVIYLRPTQLSRPIGRRIENCVVLPFHIVAPSRTVAGKIATPQRLVA